MSVTSFPPNVPQFFFDDALIAHSQRLTRRWMTAKVYPEPMLKPDQPWEGRCLKLYGTVLPEPQGNGWRMYYGIFNPKFTFKKADEKQAICPGMLLACSDDGLTWEKPELDVVTFNGRRTNLVIQSRKHLDGSPVMYDPVDADRPYKSIGFSFDNVQPMWNESFGLYTRFSKDGIHWTPQADKPVVRAGDRTNLMTTRWKGKYVAHTRAFPGDLGSDWTGGRAIFEITSDDFVHWTNPQLVLAMDLLDEQDTEYYGMAAFERHGWMVGLLERWRSASDTLELHLALSRDGRHWIHPTPRQPFIPNSHDWNRKWITCATNGPIVLGDQMVFYFGGGFTSHHFDALHLHGVIGAASVPIDRFCAIEGANIANAHFVTPPIEWPGGDLAVNADTRKSFDSHPFHCDGQIVVEVLDADGKPLSDWSGEKKATFSGNTHCRGNANPGVVEWADGRSLEALRGQVIRLKISLMHARLFTIEAKTTG